LINDPVVVPLRDRAGEQLGMDPKGIEVERRPLRGDLFEGLGIDVMAEQQRGWAIEQRSAGQRAIIAWYYIDSL
jgi:hypothetical protein